jgi:hypothetical protein
MIYIGCSTRSQARRGALVTTTLYSLSHTIVIHWVDIHLIQARQAAQPYCKIGFVFASASTHNAVNVNHNMH